MAQSKYYFIISEWNMTAEFRTCFTLLNLLLCSIVSVQLFSLMSSILEAKQQAMLSFSISSMNSYRVAQLERALAVNCTVGRSSPSCVKLTKILQLAFNSKLLGLSN